MLMRILRQIVWELFFSTRYDLSGSFSSIKGVEG